MGLMSIFAVAYLALYFIQVQSAIRKCFHRTEVNTTKLKKIYGNSNLNIYSKNKQRRKKQLELLLFVHNVECDFHPQQLLHFLAIYNVSRGQSSLTWFLMEHTRQLLFPIVLLPDPVILKVKVTIDSLNMQNKQSLVPFTVGSSP